jgi:hypothetical protein
MLEVTTVMNGMSLFVLSGAAVCAIASLGQERPAGRVIQVPPERGVYYEGPAGLVPLPTRVFMPMHEGGWREMLGLGSTKLRTVIPGANAALAIRNARPTFYLKGDRPGNMPYLLRVTRKPDHRELRLSRNRNIAEWMQFRGDGVVGLEVESLGGDLAVLKPTANLTPGEYVIVAVLEPRFRAIRLAFDFGVAQAP